ncbi:hypothetical protein KAFR_0A02730 [Kazachstania africana CBS 2517]|uniref:Nucleoporin NUP188 n=1 Tax=Kazachstania africana (strain ATCC 22294 / BCRC 22015 / CBS 2517 / CECT 1963 / NBRC 1671 / NRRL Y-8276) TaxID=1071382 RepID=H2AMV9_KAZAF|nr:hypothetical protein KAFR_0A02730 [Kazachstania africana CBS 2517]CCF55709.1 hypothetical protein KAFR_0A02730 [Kazachstania africana CBS 2517]
MSNKAIDGSKLRGPSFTFSDVEFFLKSFPNNFDFTRKDLNSSFMKVEEFLSQNKQIFKTIAEFDSDQLDQHSQKSAHSFTLRGSTYVATNEDCNIAMKLAKCLTLNFKECLRLVIQSREKNYCQVEPSLIDLTKLILRERNGVIQTLFHLINNECFPIIEDKYYNLLTNELKSEICENLINLIYKIIENSITNNIEPTEINDNEIPENDSQELLQIKNSFDVVHLANILSLLSNLFLNSATPSKIVVKWFQNLSIITDFLDSKLGIILNDSPYPTISKLGSFVTINSLLILGLDTTTFSVNIDTPYFSDTAAFLQVQDAIDKLSSNSILSYMWSFVLFTKSYIIEEDVTAHTSFLQEFRSHCGDNSHLSMLSTLFAKRAEEQNVLGSIVDLSESLSPEKFYSAIICSFLALALNFIPITIEVSKVIKFVLLKCPKDFVENFLTCDAFERSLILIKAKLPLVDEALIPLINIAIVNIEFANFELKELNTYATKTKIGELDYDIYDETLKLTGTSSEALITTSNMLSNELVVLKKETLIKPPLEFNDSILMPIPADTKGKILQGASNSSDDDLVVFMHSYSGWSLIGRALQNLGEQYSQQGNVMDEKFQDIMMSIIELTSSLISSSGSAEKTIEILGYMSSNIKKDDIISVIFKIFEVALNKRNYNISCICSDFTESLIKDLPHFVWSFLARSDILERFGKTGLASIILGTMEITNGEYDFTIKISKLATSLVQESIFQDSTIPTRTKKDILEKITTHLLHVYQSYQYWKFDNIYQKFELGFHLAKFFSNVLSNLHGMDSGASPQDRITNILAKAGRDVVMTFLGSEAQNSQASNNLLKILLSASDKQVTTIGDEGFGPTYTTLLKASFELSKSLIYIRNVLKLSPSTLEKSIFKNSSTLIEIYHSTPSMKRCIMNVFNALVSVTWNEDYPSLLAYLGDNHSKLFFNTIAADITNELSNFELSNDVYVFFGSLMQSKQYGLSILFLSGEIASQTSSNSDKLKVPVKNIKLSLLSLLKSNALQLDKLPEFAACSLLDAIAYTLDKWADGKNQSTDESFINTLMQIFKRFVPVSTLMKDDSEILTISAKYRLISRIIEIFALYLYTSNDANSLIYTLLDQDNLFSIIKPYFKMDCDGFISTNELFEEFSRNFPGYTLSSFRTDHFFNPDIQEGHELFNIELMDKLFGSEVYWAGSSELPGFKKKVVRASVQSKYMNHQISTAKAWGALLTSFVKLSSTPLKDTFIDIVCDFLELDSDANTSKFGTNSLNNEKIELTFYILYSFQTTQKSITEKKLLELLSKLITIFKTDTVDYLKNISHSNNSGTYRSILRSVLIILGLLDKKSQSIEIASDQILEFFEWAFSRGVHLIFSSILSDIGALVSNDTSKVFHNLDDKIQDLFLLLALFNKIQELKPSANFNLILASSLNELGTIKVILSLYSSFKSINRNEEPLLGYITLTFISELCTVKEVAEKFIRNGLFAVLLESPLSVTIQQGHIKPETSPGLHNAWSNGLLSILLLLLSEFGLKILPESCLFISYFSNQVKTAISTWSDSKMGVSTALIKETAQLVLLQKMLSSLNYQQYLSNSSARGNQDVDTEVVELVIGLDTYPQRKQLSSALNKLLTHPKFLNSRIIPSTIEEQNFLQDDFNRSTFVQKISREIKELQQSLFDEI